MSDLRLIQSVAVDVGYAISGLALGAGRLLQSVAIVDDDFSIVSTLGPDRRAGLVGVFGLRGYRGLPGSPGQDGAGIEDLPPDLLDPPNLVILFENALA